MTASKVEPNKSDNKYADASVADIAECWPKLHMCDRYAIAYEKVLQELPAWKQVDVVNKTEGRILDDFAKRVRELAESEKFKLN
jgi:hypothetical protein